MDLCWLLTFVAFACGVAGIIALRWIMHRLFPTLEDD
jgi:hypothetical protein